VSQFHNIKHEKEYMKLKSLIHVVIICESMIDK